MAGCVPLLMMVGCSSADSGASTSPESSGASSASSQKVVLYSGRSKDLIQPLLDTFTKQTGVAVEVRYAGTPELAAQLLEEGDSSPADAFLSQDAGALGALGKANRLAPLQRATLDKVDNKWRAADGRWIGLSGRARVIAYDPRTVPASRVPKSVFELTAPEWKGKVAIAPSNASFQSFVSAMRTISGEERTKTWLRALAANSPKTYEGNGEILKAVDAGQVPLGLINHYYWFELAAEDGINVVNAKIGWLAPGDPGAFVNVSGIGVLRGADHPETAHRLVDYLLAAQAQRYFADKTAEYPLIAAVPQSKDLPPLAQVSGPDVDLSRLDDVARTQSMLAEAGLT
jgi:iron(III) transport system substrate-binding protein